jgi:tRNA pseudouridine38-40 synthase
MEKTIEEKEKKPDEKKEEEKIENSEKNETTNNEKEKKSKIKLPKRKYEIIHGYSGHNYSGNQKNPGVKTVEEELERCLYKGGFISECNYGSIQKINWMRASRTDKGVSAGMNVVSVT